MTKKFNSFDEWAAAQPAPLVDETSDPEAPIPDPVAQWRRDGEERERQRADAANERRAIEQREIREARRHEIQLAKAAANGDVDWAAVLGAIADGFDGLTKRVEALEALLEEPDTEVLDLPNYLQPRHGVATGWPDKAGVHYSPPLLTKGTKLKASAAANSRIEVIEKRLAELERKLAKHIEQR
jgi:hypothetical protein